MANRNKKLNIYEFMQELPIEGYSSDIDAVTVTATGLTGKLTQSLILYAIEDYLAVQELKPFKFQGANGWQKGSVRYADKRSFDGSWRIWSILMVTGEQSKEVFRQSLRVGDIKYTRLDLCVDVLLKEKVFALPRKLKNAYKGEHKCTLIESLTGDTVYFGSRESDNFIRIYDKSTEYGQELGYVWRFEYEAKGETAQNVAEYLSTNGEAAIPDLVFSKMSALSVPTPKIGERVNVQGRKVTLSSAEQKLQWLGRQVAPTVKWLSKLGLREEVIEALQLDLFEVDNSEEQC